MCRVGVIIDRAADQVMAVGPGESMLCLMQQLQQRHASTPVMSAWPLLFICASIEINVPSRFCYRTRAAKQGEG